jgi:glycosyltransferase involved in cell wall biosynthesis
MTSATHLVLLPSYNTGPRLRAVVEEALAHWHPVLVVLDGCTDESVTTMTELARTEPALSVMVLPTNQGKGAAVLAGAAEALRRGFTHALVMDADGQHPATSIGEFMAASQRHPDALVLGRPQFPPNIPPERLHGRKISVGFVRFELFGAGIDDPLFGFRVYPLRPLVDVLSPRRGGRRYDFDTEAAVRLAWSGVRPLNLAAPVRYFSRAEGGVSHFHYLRDNLTLIWMHTRLITELLLWRWPGLLQHRRAWRALAAAALCACCLAPLAVGATEPVPAATAAAPVFEKVDPAAPAWAELLAAFAARHDSLAQFTERRHFPFRKQPVELTGTVRVSKQHGLSLQYVTPEARIVIFDDRGVVLRDARGDRSPPADPRAAAANAALAAVLRFDFPSLEKDFSVAGRREGSRWQLLFSPRTDAIRRTMGEIRVAGEGAHVTAIELRRTERQFIEITMHGNESRDAFSAEELARYFR